MIEFKESKFYKLLQDFFINNNKETFLQMLAEFYNRTEGILENDYNQDELIKELRKLYIELNEKGIDENIVIEKVNYFVENNVKIKDILAKLVINTNKIEDNTEKLNVNTNNIENITLQLDTNTKDLLERGINVQNAPIEDLILLDEFAETLFGYVRHEYAKTNYKNEIHERLLRLNPFSPMALLNKKPVKEKSNKTVDQDGTVTIGKKPSLPKRGSFADKFKENLILLKEGF